MPKSKRTSTRVEATVHDEAHRSNIPTTELGAFLDDKEKEPKPVLYPRDPSLDPQLVWKGKDEQDRYPLEVPAVPIYIQEKIHPKALIEALRAEKAGAEAQLDLWGDFDGIRFEDLVEFYQHEQNWSNRMILGDSLLVMTSLAEKEGLKGKVQMIYMDPPYGIKFGSNWQVSTRKRDVKDGKAEDVIRQPEQVKAFRDTWELGIHSYLTYLRDRFVVARELLTTSGSVFVQIGDENVHLVGALLDEVYGSKNFIAQIAFAKTTGFSGEYLSSICDLILWYGKDREHLKYRQLYREKAAGDEGASKYRPVSTIKALQDKGFVPERLATSADLTSQGESVASDQRFEFEGRIWLPPPGLHWKTTVGGMRKLAIAGRIILEGNSLRYVRYLDDFAVFPNSNIWLDIGGVQSRTDPKVYVVQTAVEAIKRCLIMSTDPGDLVLDPTCGSGTTALVAEHWGRRWITIDTSRVALALARQRLMAATLPYYTLADSPDGARLLAQQAGHFHGFDTTTSGDLRKGFIYKTVPQYEELITNDDLSLV